MVHSSAPNWWASQGSRVRILLITAVAAAAVAGGTIAVKKHGTAHIPSKLGGDITLTQPNREKHPYLGFSTYIWRAQGGLTPGTTVRLLKTAGATMLRDTLDWEALEPTRGSWNEHAWKKYLDFYRLLRTAGITPLWTLQNAPSWATVQRPQLFGTPSVNCRVPFGCLADPPAEHYIPDFARFAVEAAKRMPAAQFEVWNEPNLKTSWQPYDIDPALYTKMQCAVYRAVKDASPKTIVTSGGINGSLGGEGAMSAKDFLSASYKDGLNDCIDDLSLHVYPLSDGFADGSYFKLQWDAINTVRNDNQDSHPVYVTETGIPTGGAKSVSDSDQKAILEEDYQRLRTFYKTPGYPPIYAILIHTLQDYSVPGTTPSPDDPEPHFGLLNAGESTSPRPKPAFCWMVSMARKNYAGC